MSLDISMVVGYGFKFKMEDVQDFFEPFYEYDISYHCYAFDKDNVIYILPQESSIKATPMIDVINQDDVKPLDMDSEIVSQLHKLLVNDFKLNNVETGYFSFLNCSR